MSNDECDDSQSSLLNAQSHLNLYGTINNAPEPDPNLDDLFVDKSLKFNSKYVADCFLSAFVFGPLSGLYCYGTWSIFDMYFLPDNLFISSLFGYLISFIILLPGYVFQEHLQDFYNSLNRKKQFSVRIVHAYVIGLAYTLQGRGCWSLVDKYILSTWRGGLVLAIIALTFLLITRSMRMITSSPFLLSADSSEYYFLSRSQFKFQNVNSTYVQYAFDFIVVEVFESFAVNIAWRDLSYLFDMYLYPNDQFMNSIVSAVFGYFLFFLVAFTQLQVYYIISKYTLIPRLFVESIYNSLMFLSAIVLWRIYWTIPDTYILVKDYQIEIYLASHFGSYVLAILLQASVVITGSGYDFNDGEINEDGCFFLISYLTELLPKTSEERDETLAST